MSSYEWELMSFLTDPQRIELIDKLRSQVEFLVAGEEDALPARDKFPSDLPTQAGGGPIP